MYKIVKTKTFAVSAAAAAIPILMLLLIPNVYAGGAREDWDERYTSIPGAPECWVDGYDDGQDNPFSQDRHRGCIFDIDDEIVVASDNELCCNGKPYYEGFMFGCMDVEGNTEEDCERATD